MQHDLVVRQQTILASPRNSQRRRDVLSAISKKSESSDPQRPLGLRIASPCHRLLIRAPLDHRCDSRVARFRSARSISQGSSTLPFALSAAIQSFVVENSRSDSSYQLTFPPDEKSTRNLSIVWPRQPSDRRGVSLPRDKTMSYFKRRNGGAERYANKRGTRANLLTIAAKVTQRLSGATHRLFVYHSRTWPLLSGVSAHACCYAWVTYVQGKVIDSCRLLRQLGNLVIYYRHIR